MYPFYFCAVFLFLVIVSSSIVPREHGKEEAFLFYKQETKNVNYSISKVSQATYEGVNQTFIQRQRRNAQGNNFRHPMLRMKTIVNLQQYFIVCVFTLCTSSDFSLKTSNKADPR